MNRILFASEEKKGDQVVLTDERADHIRTVLRASAGDILKIGELNGPVSKGEILALSDEQVTLRIEEGEMPPRPPRDLILALPRPKVLNRLLPQLASLGVDRLFLCNASRVEKYYFDSHVLEEAHLRKQLVEGLVQCGDTRVPEVHIRIQLRHFLEDEVSGLVADADAWMLHPSAELPLGSSPGIHAKQVLAIGPEGGWLTSELEAFVEAGFQCRSLTHRVLRSDTAVLAALSVVAITQEETHGRS